MYGPVIFARIAFVSLLLASYTPGQIPLPVRGGVETLPRMSTWCDPHSRPETYQEYMQHRSLGGGQSDGPFRAQLTYRSPSIIYQYGNRFDILVNADLCLPLQVELAGYMDDLEIEGWAVSLFRCSGGTPPEMRAFLGGRYTNYGIKGCVLVGDLPIAWYETNGNKHQEFPCDLYYMDLTGRFIDIDNDNLYDLHTEVNYLDTLPEIFVGRLTASPLAFNFGTTEVALLKNYFRKVREYRRGILTAPPRALSFCDDDWPGLKSYQELAFSQVVEVKDQASTTASGYRKSLKQGYASVLLAAHSSPTMHQFKLAGRDNYFGTGDLWKADPPCLFYNLFACANSRYTSQAYMGGVYIFVKSKGLVAVGSTKSAGMVSLPGYYQPLGQGKCFGEAFRLWWITRYPYTSNKVDWSYGMTLLGDPTLRTKPALLTPSMTQIPPTGGKVDLTLAGQVHSQGDHYLVLASFSGSQPGFLLPGVRLPLNLDIYTPLFLENPALLNAVGVLDYQGSSRIALNLPAPLPSPLIGRSLSLSALVIDQVNSKCRFSTPAVTLKF